MTLQEVWSLLNLYNSSFSGEQIDEAIGVILNGGISAAVEAAQQSADAAAKSATDAAGSAAGVSAAATNAQSAASRASGSATESESYAHGGTGTREGEDEDNARYYSEEAKKAAGNAAADAVAEAETRLTQYVQDAEVAKDAAEDAAQTLNSAQINAAGHLILTAPDGSTRDLGDVTGKDGSSIRSITRTAGNGAPGTTDTYTVTLTDGSTTQFQVYNGKDGAGSGDMTAAVYDPQGKAQDVFAYADTKLSKAGGQLTGELKGSNAEFTGVIRNGVALNVINTAFRQTMDEIVVKTKIPYIDYGPYMPVIRLWGYAYGNQSPIDMSVAFYPYNGYFTNLGCTSTCPWKPTIKASTYIDPTDGVEYCAISFIGRIYYCGFIVDYYDILEGTSAAGGWTMETNFTESSGVSIVPQEKLTEIPYRPIANDISGNAATATTITTILPIEKGGTGAATAADARTALGVPSTDEMNTAISNATKDVVTESEMTTAISTATTGLVTTTEMNTAIANAIGAAIEGGY